MSRKRDMAKARSIMEHLINERRKRDALDYAEMNKEIDKCESNERLQDRLRVEEVITARGKKRYEEPSVYSGDWKQYLHDTYKEFCNKWDNDRVKRFHANVRKHKGAVK